MGTISLAKVTGAAPTSAAIASPGNSRKAPRQNAPLMVCSFPQAAPRILRESRSFPGRSQAYQPTSQWVVGQFEHDADFRPENASRINLTTSRRGDCATVLVSTL